jgi:4-hydroxybenzoate polyprenyltransferase
MYSLRYFMLEPILGMYGYSLISSHFEFSLMVFSVLLITGAASIINNYFDRKSDLMNRPNDVIVGTIINRRFAIILHSVLSFIGVIVGFYLCALSGHFWYGLSFILISIIFYLYSGYFKRRLLIGNIIISLLIAGITFLPWLTEFVFAKSHYTQAFPSKIYHHLMILSLGFSVAAFLLNLAREIIKDIVDFRGDYQTGSKTIPIVYGKQLARRISSLTLLLTGLFIITSWFVYLRNIPAIQHNIINTNKKYMIVVSMFSNKYFILFIIYLLVSINLRSNTIFIGSVATPLLKNILVTPITLCFKYDVSFFSSETYLVRGVLLILFVLSSVCVNSSTCLTLSCLTTISFANLLICTALSNLLNALA